MFSKGKSVNAYPLKVIYSVSEDNTFVLRAGVTTSSRNFKKAVDRNRIKRLLREAYRLQKLPLQSSLEERKQTVFLFFIYTGKTMPGFDDIYIKMEGILNQLSEKIKNLPLKS